MNDIENHMLGPDLSRPTAKDEDRSDELRQQETDDYGSLTARLAMTIRHIAAHASFDQRDLIQLLKDLQRDRADLKLRLDDINQRLDKIMQSPVFRSQAE